MKASQAWVAGRALGPLRASLHAWAHTGALASRTQVPAKTIHGFCLRVLRRHWRALKALAGDGTAKFKAAPSVWDTTQTKRLVALAMKWADLSRGQKEAAEFLGMPGTSQWPAIADEVRRQHPGACRRGCPRPYAGLRESPATHDQGTQGPARGFGGPARHMPHNETNTPFARRHVQLSLSHCNGGA